MDRMEARLPSSTIESPKFRRSPVYLFYFTSRIGLARQFSAVDIMHLANKLMFAANEEADGELAAATAQSASELGQYALFFATSSTDAEKRRSVYREDEGSYLVGRCCIRRGKDLSRKGDHCIRAPQHVRSHPHNVAYAIDRPDSPSFRATSVRHQENRGDLR